MFTWLATNLWWIGPVLVGGLCWRIDRRKQRRIRAIEDRITTYCYTQDDYTTVYTIESADRFVPIGPYHLFPQEGMDWELTNDFVTNPAGYRIVEEEKAK